MDYTIVQKGSGDILTLSQIVQHLRVYDEYDENYILQLYDAAVNAAELYMNRVILESTVIMETDALTRKLPQGVASSVQSVTYMDDSENRVPLFNYSFNSITNRIDLSKSGALALKTDNASKYQVTFVTGWKEDEVPSVIKQAILILIGSMYEMREDSVIGQGVTVNKVPNTHKQLLSKYKIRRMG